MVGSNHKNPPVWPNSAVPTFWVRTFRFTVEVAATNAPSLIMYWRAPTSSTCIAPGSVGAGYLFSLAATFLFRGEVFYEASVVLLAFVLFGHWMEMKARRGSSDSVRKLLDPLEHFFLVMAQPYFLRRYRDYPIENLEAKLYVLINSVLFTAIHYQKQENQAVGEAQLIRALTDMIVGLLEGAPVSPKGG